jgi:hypothetical protein
MIVGDLKSASFDVTLRITSSNLIIWEEMVICVRCLKGS